MKGPREGSFNVYLCVCVCARARTRVRSCVRVLLLVCKCVRAHEVGTMANTSSRAGSSLGLRALQTHKGTYVCLYVCIYV